jgi:PqqD family protein of HPr-rel-A system
MPPEILDAPPHAGHRWQLARGQQLHYHTWDHAEFVLYNDLSGDTHLLDADSIDLLRRLQAGAADTAALALAFQSDAEETAALEALLHELAKQALVEPATC